MADKSSAIANREQEGLSGREHRWPDSPFRMLERFANEIDGVFDDFGLGRNWFSPRGRAASGQGQLWAPAVDVHQENNELVVRADLPGLKKEDIRIDVTDDEITIAGERRQKQETTENGVYRSERSYGSFCRTIPLPDGAMTDQANATFKDGVLEIKMPAPPEQVTKGRRLEIKEETEGKK